MNIKVSSFNQVYMKHLKCPIIAIYINPDDFSNKCVARLYDLEKPTSVVLIKDSLEEIRQDIINSCPNMVRFDRAKNDPRCIVETWI